MSLSRAVHTLINDIGHLNCLYQQIQEVPPEVQTLFQRIDTVYGRLIDIGVQLACREVSISFDRFFQEFTNFRSVLLDLEVFIDPGQSLPRSSPRGDVANDVLWSGVIGQEMVEKCNNVDNRFAQLEKECVDLLSTLRSIGPYHEDDTGLEKDEYTEPKFSPSYLSFVPDSAPKSSPSIVPHFNPLTSPLLSPRKPDSHSVATISMAGLISGTPFSAGVPHGDTLGHLPSLTSSTVVRRKKPGRKTLAERKVAELLQQQYGRTVAAGVKRKRHEHNTTHVDAISQTSLSNSPRSPGRTAQLAIPSTPPPKYPPSSPRLGPSSDPLEAHPAWSLDDLNDSLPPLPMSSNAKGKQRAVSSSNETWESGSSDNTSSSANSIHSSVREGSVLSTTSKDRMFDDGAVKIWYHQGTTLQSITITHMEVRRTARPSGDGTVIIARTASNQDIVHDLWLSEKKINCCPFIDNCEILAAMRDQHDPGIAAMVHFAPNLTKHPQYSFASKQDCWEFMQMVTGKTLIASIDIATIKSACTHGNAAESGCDTIQVWEDRDPTTTKFIKFFRNKNGNAAHSVVEVNVNCLRAPTREGRTRKLVFAFRDVQRGTLREMSYLKIAFSNDCAENEFLGHCGFAIASGSKT